MKVAPFKPPPGFEKSSSKNSSKTPQLFSKSNLEGKEVWYITAPASVPLASVTEMSLRDAKLGKAVFSQNGNDYGFVHDPLDDKAYTKILLPSNSKDGYSIGNLPRPPMRLSILIYNYREKIRGPNISYATNR